LRGGGSPIERSTARFMEARFGRGFQHVRIHTGPQAAKAAADVDARAFTTGKHIVFGEGEYRPQSSEGRRLLAHELTHVVQQSGAGQAPYKTISQPEEPAEQEARNVSRQVAAGIADPLTVELRSVTSVQRFEGWEHEELGDTTGVKTIDLGNGKVLSWGQIVALAGDYYGSVEDLRAATETEEGRKGIEAALKKVEHPVEMTSLPKALQEKFVELAMYNIPHFLGGGTSKDTWLEYHSRAIGTAVHAGVAGTLLDDAYLLEAFGEHFYTDSFSGGHIRTPRKEILDWYRTVFGPRVWDHFVNTLRTRVEKEIYDQNRGLIFVTCGVLGFLPGFNLGCEEYIRIKIHERVEERLAKFENDKGGHARMAALFGDLVAGMIAGTIHDLEGGKIENGAVIKQGVVVNSKAHPDEWTAYGDSLLDAPQNKTSKGEAIAGIAEAKNDIDEAYEIGKAEAAPAISIPPPSALPKIIYFTFDSWALSGTAGSEIGAALAYMKYNPDVTVRIVGYTDEIGTPIYNLGLGTRRADAIASVLLKGGVNAKRVTAATEGETGATTIPAYYYLDRRAVLTWTLPPAPTASPDLPAEIRARAAVQSRIGPPYLAERRFPEPVPGKNPDLPEWHWGKLAPIFQMKIAAWVRQKVTGELKGKLDEMKPIPIEFNGVHVTDVDVRSIAQGIANDALGDPIKFLNEAFGEEAGPWF
jgi:outer membrane protein OmpA-like peptidoglycan-associated protein